MALRWILAGQLVKTPRIAAFAGQATELTHFLVIPDVRADADADCRRQYQDRSTSTLDARQAIVEDGS